MLASGRKFSASILKLVPECELSLIKIEATDLPALPLGRSSDLRIGDPVVTLGNAFRITEIEAQVALCSGAISGILSLEANDSSESQYRGQVIETTAAINPGVDGGPLVNDRGQIIGLLSLGYSKRRFLGTAVPVDQLRFHLEGSANFGGALGVEASRLPDGSLSIDFVYETRPAALAGIRVGDRILRVSGQKLEDMKRWLSLLDKLPPGSNLKLLLARGEFERELEIRLGEPSPGLALTLSSEPLTVPNAQAQARAQVFRKALAACQASLVTVKVASRPRGGAQSEMLTRGSGLIASADGFILTTDNIIGRAELIRVVLADGRELRAELRGRARAMDLALLKVDATGLQAAPFRADRGDSEPGTICAVLGRGLSDVTMTMGIISATGRQRGCCYQVDAIMNLANAGGALVNARGEVIGLANFVGDDSRWRWGSSSGVGFALTTAKLFEVLDDLKAGRSADAMPTLGVISKAGTLVIESIVPSTPAERAGLQAGDRITAVDGKALSGWGDLIKAVRQKLRGDSLVLTIQRGDRELTIEARL